MSASQIPAGRIGDLKVEVIPEDLKARLSWTSPDMGGQSVSRYDIKYAKLVTDIADNFEINALSWDFGQAFPLAPGSDTTFTLDMSQNRELLDTPLYFAVRAHVSESKAGTISNWVRVFMPSPPPPPTVPPTFSAHDQTSWPFPINSAGVDHVGSSMAKNMNLGLEIILPIAIGFIFLIILLVLYCYFCVIKRRHRSDHKKTEKHNANVSDKLNSTITIIPGSPSNNPQTINQQGYANQIDIPDHHTIGVPQPNYDGYDDEPKKRFSLVRQEEQQLIEELKQQQMQHQQREQMNTPNNNYGVLSVISNNTLQRGGHTLSPYNSWSASQLLHEHERRHSPMENMMNEDPMLVQHQDMLMNGSQIDHMSLNGQNIDHLSMSGHQGQMPEHYNQGHIPPPVPPLPAYNANGYPTNYNIYGMHQPQIPPNQQIYQSMQRNETLVPFNPSLQGSVSSVNSGEKKRRNVTMV